MNRILSINRTNTTTRVLLIFTLLFCTFLQNTNVEVPIVYNSYGALYHLGVNEKNVMSLIPRAAEVGAEVFIIDDDWQTEIEERKSNSLVLYGLH